MRSKKIFKALKTLVLSHTNSFEVTESQNKRHEIVLYKYNTKKMGVLGVSGDSKEAVLFAALANQWAAGKEGFPSHFLKNEPFYMGKLSFPY